MECLREFHESFHVLTHKFLVLPWKKPSIKWYVVNHKKCSFALKTDFQPATTTTLLHLRVRIENSAKLLNQEKEKLIRVLSTRNNLTFWASGLRADPQYKGLRSGSLLKGSGSMSLFFRFQTLSGRQYFDNLIVTSAKSLADLSLTRFTQGVSKTSSRARKLSSRSANNESLVISYCTRRRATHSFVRRSIFPLTFPLITKK